jgi:alginate O-acetyltransferase complex protein AlgI
VGHAYTLLVVLVGWVFFRAVDLTSAVAYLGKMVGLGERAVTVAYPPSFFLNTEVMAALLLGFVLVTPVYHRFQRFWQTLPATGPRELAYSVFLFSLFIMAVMYLAADTYNPFIYFRF